METKKLYDLSVEEENVLSEAIHCYAILNKKDVCAYPVDDITTPITIEIFHYKHKNKYFIDFSFDAIHSSLKHTLKNPDWNKLHSFKVEVYTND